MKPPRFGWTKLTYSYNGKPLGVVAAAIYDHQQLRGVVTLPADELARGIPDNLWDYAWVAPSQLAKRFPPTRAGFNRALDSMGNAMSFLQLTDLLWCNENVPVSQHMSYLQDALYLVRTAP